VAHCGLIDGDVRPPADVSRDGVVDASDVELAGYLMTADPLVQSLFVTDMDLDGQTTLADVFVIAHVANEQTGFEPFCPDIINEVDQDEFDCDPDPGGGPEQPDFPPGGGGAGDEECDDLPRTDEIECALWATCVVDEEIEECEEMERELIDRINEISDELGECVTTSPEAITYHAARACRDKAVEEALQAVDRNVRRDMGRAGDRALHSTLAGAASGASFIGAAGAWVGGPPGALAGAVGGGLIGTLVGLAVGSRGAAMDVSNITEDAEAARVLIRSAGNGEAVNQPVSNTVFQKGQAYATARNALREKVAEGEAAYNQAVEAWRDQRDVCDQMRAERDGRMQELGEACVDGLGGGL
jgi:outer membrane lipoprotein SlyB